jgi:hypothetical protein
MKPNADVALRYTVRSCPCCHGQGLLWAWWHESGQRVVLLCDECYAAWSDPRDIDSEGKGCLGLEFDGGSATWEQLKAAGWDAAAFVADRTH